MSMAPTIGVPNRARARYTASFVTVQGGSVRRNITSILGAQGICVESEALVTNNLMRLGPTVYRIELVVYPENGLGMSVPALKVSIDQAIYMATGASVEQSSMVPA